MFENIKGWFMDRPYELRRLIVWRVFALLTFGFVVYLGFEGRLDTLTSLLPWVLGAVSLRISHEHRTLNAPLPAWIWDRLFVFAMLIGCFMLVVLMLKTTLLVPIWDEPVLWVALALLLFGITTIVVSLIGFTASSGTYWGMPSILPWYGLAFALMLLIPISAILSINFPIYHWVFAIPTALFIGALGGTEFWLWVHYKHTEERRREAHEEPLTDQP